MKKTFNIEEIKGLLDATFRIIDAAKRSDDPLNINTELQFLNLFIETMLSRALNQKMPSGTSKKEQFEVLKNNYVKLKLCIQEATALAFEQSMSKFSKQPVEYYCVIQTVQTTSGQTTH